MVLARRLDAEAVIYADRGCLVNEKERENDAYAAD